MVADAGLLRGFRGFLFGMNALLFVVFAFRTHDCLPLKMVSDVLQIKRAREKASCQPHEC